MDEKPPLPPPDEENPLETEGDSFQRDDALDALGPDPLVEGEAIGTADEPTPTADEGLQGGRRGRGGKPPPAKTIEEQRRELQEEERAKGEGTIGGRRRRGLADPHQRFG